jgi:ATP-binding cassette subfamily B protein
MLGSDDATKPLSELDPRLFIRLWGYIRHYLGKTVVSIVCMLLTSATGLIAPTLLRYAIDYGMLKQNMQVINQMVLIYIVAYAGNWFFTYWQTYLMSKVGQDIIFDIRQDLFVKLQNLGLQFYDKWQAGRIMSRLTNDIDALHQLVTSGLTNIINDIFTLVTIIIIMLTMNWRLALITFLTVPIILLTTLYFTRKMRAAYFVVRRTIADVNANLQESISGIKVTQSFTREDQNADRFDAVNESNFQASMLAAVLHSAFFPIVELIGALGTALVLGFGGVFIVRNVGGMTVGTVSAFLVYVTRFFHPIRDLSNVLNTIQSAGVSLERIFEYMDEVPDVQNVENAIALKPIIGEVEYRNVDFSYTPGQQVLYDINFKIPKGDTIAFVGATGAGKSSIINLLCRFYDPQAGAVYIDGQDIKEVTLNSLRSQLGIVLQDTFIFSGTVRDNIRYGKPEASSEEVIDAAKAVNAHDFIMRLPDGYDTQVQERGSRLSVGQRQLISFARTLLADPAILILDEATSSVDAYTELLIQKALDRLLTGRTALVIAHRLSTIRNADCIYTLDKGHIMEAGSHHELLQQNGVYRKLYELQFKDQEDYNAVNK